MMGDGRRSAAQSDGVIFCGAHTALVKKASSVAGRHIEHNTPWAWVLCQPAHRKLQLTTAFINDWWPHKPSNPQLRTIQRVHWEQWNCSQSEKTTAARDSLQQFFKVKSYRNCKVLSEALSLRDPVHFFQCIYCLMRHDFSWVAWINMNLMWTPGSDLKCSPGGLSLDSMWMLNDE